MFKTIPIHFMGYLIDAGLLLGLIGIVIASERINEKKINRAYERLDILKNGVRKDFVPKDVCKILHEQQSRDIAEIKADVKLLLKQGSNH